MRGSLACVASRRTSQSQSPASQSYRLHCVAATSYRRRSIHEELIMKKTIQPKKLQLSRTTLRMLSSSNLSEAHGGLVGQAFRVFTEISCSCKHSVCDSCYNTDCCLIVP